MCLFRRYNKGRWYSNRRSTWAASRLIKNLIRINDQMLTTSITFKFNVSLCSPSCRLSIELKSIISVWTLKAMSYKSWKPSHGIVSTSKWEWNQNLVNHCLIKIILLLLLLFRHCLWNSSMGEKARNNWKLTWSNRDTKSWKPSLTGTCWPTTTFSKRSPSIQQLASLKSFEHYDPISIH